MSHNQVLSDCPLFKTPIYLNDGSIYKEIKTVVCSNTKDIEATLKSLRDDELVFVIRFQDLDNGDLNLSFALFSSKSSGKVEIISMVDGFLFFDGGPEFFGIDFTLSFMFGCAA